MKITFLRHGETEHNKTRTWQGHAQGSLSEHGRAQAAAAASRLGTYDVVVASDLQRVRETVETLGVDAQVDAAWREIDVGTWAGKTFQETLDEDPETHAALRQGHDVAFGGGETMSQLGARVAAAITELWGKLDDDGHALVVTHGGVVMSVVAELLQLRAVRNGTVAPTNTSFTTIERRFDLTRLAQFNDAAHLGHHPGALGDAIDAGESITTVIRHGLTDANVREIWQGQNDWGLNDTGRSQAAALGAHMTDLERVVSSPLGRARQTAQAVHSEPEVHDGLMEINMGQWEGLTSDEVSKQWPGELDLMFKEGIDIRRGVDGENWDDLTARVGATFDELVAGSGNGVSLGVVAHGSSLRALVLRLVGGGWERARRTGILPNTGYGRLVRSRGRWLIADYGLAPHLE